MTQQRSGYDIARSVDPNTSNDVCTFCVHATGDRKADLFAYHPKCGLGFESYFQSLSNMGPIWVSDCGKGELLPGLKAIDKNKVPA